MLVDHHLLEKYWAGLCTPEERKAVEQWMSDGIPEDSYELRTPEAENTIKTLLWQQIIQTQEIVKHEEPVKTTRIPTWPKVIAIAAMLVLISGISLYISNKIIINNSTNNTIIKYQEVAIPYGKKAQVTLPDGTKVYLNSGSKLRYPPKFPSNKRMVFLEGEGFFQVTKDPTKPFFVQTKQTTTRVLGTHFNLQSWKGKSDILNVEEGRVQFTAKGCADTLLLNANTQGVFDGHSLEKTMINSRNRVSWTKGMLVFNDVKLSEAAADLERWYAIRIQLNDPLLANNRVKAQFDNPSLIEVLRDISFALNIKYKIKDKEVILSR